METKKSPNVNNLHSSGFTLMELLVVIAIIALLMSILMPSLQKAKETARALVCASNQRQLGLGINLYAYDYSNCLPPGFGYPDVDNAWLEWWGIKISPYIVNKIEDSLYHVKVKEFYCPSNKLHLPYQGEAGKGFTYAMPRKLSTTIPYYGGHRTFQKISSIKRPSETITLIDYYWASPFLHHKNFVPWWAPNPSNYTPLIHGMKYDNILLLDGHVEKMRNNEEGFVTNF